MAGRAGSRELMTGRMATHNEDWVYSGAQGDVEHLLLLKYDFYSVPQTADSENTIQWCIYEKDDRPTPNIYIKTSADV